MSSSAKELTLAQRLYASGMASSNEPIRAQVSNPPLVTNTLPRAGAPPAPSQLSGANVQVPAMTTSHSAPPLVNVRTFGGNHDSSSFYHKSVMPQQLQATDPGSLPRHNRLNTPGSASSFSPPLYSAPQPQNATGPIEAYPSREGSYMYAPSTPSSPGSPGIRSLRGSPPSPPMPTPVTPYSSLHVPPPGAATTQPYYPATPITPLGGQYPQVQAHFAQMPPGPGPSPPIMSPPNQVNMMPIQSPPQSPPGAVAATQQQQQQQQQPLPHKKSNLVRNTLIGVAGVGAVGLAIVAGTELFDNNDNSNNSGSGDTSGIFNFFGSGDGSSSTDGDVVPASGPDSSMMLAYDSSMVDPNATTDPGMVVPSDGYYYPVAQQSSQQSSNHSENTLHELGQVAGAAYEVGGFVEEHSRPPPQHAYTYPGYPLPPGQYPAGVGLQPNPGMQGPGAQNAAGPSKTSGKFGIKPETMATIHKVGTYAKGAAAVAKLGVGLAKLTS